MTAYHIRERYGATSRGGARSKDAERKFDIIADDENGSFEEADAFFRGWASSGASFFNGLPADREEGIDVEADEESPQLWRATVRYKTPSFENPSEGPTVRYGAYVSSFSASNGTAHIQRSLGTTFYPIGGPAPNFFGMIGWNGEGFDGCDKVVPNFAFEITSQTAPGTVENFGALADTLAQYVGKVNATRFMGFNPGVVLYAGVSSGSIQTSPATETSDEFHYWRVTHQFLASPNASVDVDGVPVWKPGWAYLWTLNAKAYDPTTNMIVPKIVAAYVEQVYESADFAGLGLGYSI